MQQYAICIQPFPLSEIATQEALLPTSTRNSSNMYLKIIATPFFHQISYHDALASSDLSTMATLQLFKIVRLCSWPE